ncbi:DNA-primase RepB domain-containing protein [Halomonas alimentaria]|uniref:RepB-like DNA primase domain-containing protein n=1 Tax=Halomonas alimentaria TaxID=147248 RepID=A0A7X5AR10_9GAMM|nr:DNA-primase RepB domain-containing protein [Halomonas alimentaria]NAW35012.1 hypothetical protein [Halomonas alimentaria]
MTLDTESVNFSDAACEPSAHGQELVVDLEEAQRFLDVVQPSGSLIFLAKPEADSNRGKPYQRRGSLSSLGRRLTRLNREGHAIYWGAQEYEGKARRSENTAAFRNLVADLDAPDTTRLERLPSVLEERRLPLPTFIVESSPGKHQLVWTVPVDWSPLPGTEEYLTKALANLLSDEGADPAVAKLSQPFRLPGFFHQKREPFRSRIVGGTGRPVSPPIVVQRAASKLMFEEEVARVRARMEQGEEADGRWGLNIEAARQYLTYVDPIINGDHESWKTIVGGIQHEVGHLEGGLELMLEWCRGDLAGAWNPAFDEKENRSLWKFFSRASGVSRPTWASVAKAAKEGGANLKALAREHLPEREAEGGGSFTIESISKDQWKLVGGRHASLPDLSVVEQCGAIENGFDAIGGSSCVVWADRGAGKTSKVFAPMVEKGNAVVLLSHLISLCGETARRLGMGLYSNDPSTWGSKLVTTPHTAAISESVKGHIRDSNLILIDEFSSEAEVLFDHRGNIKNPAAMAVLALLKEVVDSGAQVVMADADITPPGGHLMEYLGITRVLRFDSVHRRKKLNLYLSGKDKNGNETRAVGEMARNAKKAYLFHDNRNDVEAWGERGYLAFTSETRGLAEQKLFMSDIPRWIKEQPLLAASPVWQSGLSLEYDVRDVLGFYDGITAPESLMQQAERQREATDDTIHVQLTSMAWRSRSGVGGNLEDWRKTLKDTLPEEGPAYLDLAESGVNESISAWVGGVATKIVADNGWRTCPAVALVVYALEAGYDVEIIEPEDIEADVEHEVSKKSVKQRRVDRVASAGRVESWEEVEELKKLEPTPELSARIARGSAELQLHVTDGDLDEDGNMPEDMAKEVQSGELVKRSKLASWLWVDHENLQGKRHGRMDECVLKRLADITAAKAGLDPFNPTKPGRHVLRSADEAVDMMKAIQEVVGGKTREANRVLSLGGLPALLNDKERKAADNKDLGSWFSGWMGAWGYVSTRVQEKGVKQRRYRWSMKPSYAIFGKRIADDKNGVWGNLGKLPQTDTESPASPVVDGFSEADPRGDSTICSSERSASRKPATDPLARASKGGLPGVKKGRKKTSRDTLADIGSEGSSRREMGEALREIRQDRIGAIPTTPRSEWTAQQRIDSLLVMSGFAQPGGVRFEGLELSANDGEYAKQSAA